MPTKKAKEMDPTTEPDKTSDVKIIDVSFGPLVQDLGARLITY